MFSKTCKYAIRAALYLAQYTDRNNKIGVAGLAESLNAPRHFLAKILQQLSKHGLVSSAKGPNGGFYLSEKNMEATLYDVIICIDGPAFFNGCVMGLPQCSDEKPCPLHVQANAYRQGMHYQLKFQTLKEIAATVEKKSLRI